MRKALLLLSVIAIISCTNAQEFSEAALSEKLTDLNGKKVTFKNILKKYRGKTLLIEVWASWCGDCVKAMPAFKELQAANPNVEYLFISMDRAEDKWKAGIEKHQLKGGHYWAVDGMKGEYAKAIELDWIPRYIVVDKKGKIVLFRAIETDLDKIDSTLKAIK